MTTGGAVFNREHPPGFRWLHESFGTNMRMTEMQAAIGRIPLRKLEEWSARRTSNALQITATLAKYPCIRVPQPSSDIRHAYYRLYAFVVSEYLADGWSRDRVMQEINDGGAPCFSGSCPEIYNEKAFEREGLRPAQALPNARALGPVSLAFLFHPTLSSDDMDMVCRTIDRVLSDARI
jgi:dTDP-4-amino-4,6-dideoxygalactose transaminase